MFFKRLGLWAVISALGALSAYSADPSVERGKYLTEEVAKCQDCHTQRLETGELDKTKWLKGAVLDFAPLQPVPGWHKTSPNLTPDGNLWKKWGEKGLIEYLKTGLTPKGTPADPPMPAYKLKPEDAEAIVAYLKTLQ